MIKERNTVQPKHVAVDGRVDLDDLESKKRIVLLEFKDHSATLELSQLEAMKIGNRLRFYGNRARIDSGPQEIIERVWTEVFPDKDRVDIWIEGTQVKTSMIRTEALSIGYQLLYRGRVDRDPIHKNNQPPEEIDEVLLDDIKSNRVRPHNGVPYGQKGEYIRELKRAGWTINEIMLRLKVSGQVVARELESL
jgi:hypothetical protein